MEKRQYTKRATITTGDVEVRDDATIDLSSTIKTEDIDRPDLAIVVDESMQSPHVTEYVKDLAFMEDILTVVVGEVPDKNAENPVPVGVNGVVKFLKRGVEYKLPRKFVDSLIKVETSVKTAQFTDASGVEQTRIDTENSLKYPISILHDPADERRHPNGSPLGRAWFQHQCKAA